MRPAPVEVAGMQQEPAGAEAARAEHVQARPAFGRDGFGAAPPDRASVLALQRTAGNAAALAGSLGVATSPRPRGR